MKHTEKLNAVGDRRTDGQIKLENTLNVHMLVFFFPANRKFALNSTCFEMLLNVLHVQNMKLCSVCPDKMRGRVKKKKKPS